MLLVSLPNFLQKMGYHKFEFYIGLIIPFWAIFMAILERFFPYTKGYKIFRRGFWLDLIWYTFIQSYVLQIIIFQYIIIPLKAYFNVSITSFMTHWSFGSIVLFFFLTHDFYIYWFHRLQHNSPWLWRTHEAHHSVREVDWLAGSRSHFIEILINQTIEFLPIFFLLDTNTAAFVVPLKAMIDALWGMWIHANINIKTYYLQYIINGPEMHQWHHANHEEVFYKNYSTKLAIWDWIFGTGFIPGLKPLSFHFLRPKMYGLPYGYPSGFFDQMLYAIKRFDYRSIERQGVYSELLTMRYDITKAIASFFNVKSQWISSEIFDKTNKIYEIDNQIKPCNHCGQAMKYYYSNDSMKYSCQKCESNTSNLDKFD